MALINEITNLYLANISGPSFFHTFWELFSRLFAAMCPLAVLALFISMTPTLTIKERIETAKRGTFIAWIVMMITVIVGPKFLASIGITQDSFEIAGGIFLAIIGFQMLRSDDPEVEVNDKDIKHDVRRKPKHKLDIAITPLGVPLIAGPGVITVLMSHCGQPNGGIMSIFGAIMAVTFVAFGTYVMLVFVSQGCKWLTPMVLKLSFRLSGLFLVSIGVQLAMKGIKVSGIFSSASVIS